MSTMTKELEQLIVALDCDRRGHKFKASHLNICRNILHVRYDRDWDESCGLFRQKEVEMEGRRSNIVSHFSATLINL